jgi:hypothetical protein
MCWFGHVERMEGNRIACVESVGIVCPLLVGCVVLRGWLLRRRCPGVAC